MSDRPIIVSTYAGYRGDERPSSVHINKKSPIAVMAVERMWLEENAVTGRRSRCFTLRLAAGTVRSVRLDDQGSWFLRMT